MVGDRAFADGSITPADFVETESGLINWNEYGTGIQIR